MNQKEYTKGKEMMSKARQIFLDVMHDRNGFVEGCYLSSSCLCFPIVGFSSAVVLYNRTGLEIGFNLSPIDLGEEWSMSGKLYPCVIKCPSLIY